MKIVLWENCKVIGEYELPGPADLEIGIDTLNEVLSVEDQYNISHTLDWGGKWT